MLCPFCKSHAFEMDAECGRCGLSLEKADRLFGTVPRLSGEITDFAQIFNERDKKKIVAASSGMRSRFPQVRFSVIGTSLNPETPLGVYAFWIFNRGGLCREIEKGGENHDVLLTIDAGNHRSNLIIGYGLEPFVGPSHLERVLASARDEFAHNRFGKGVVTLVGALSQTLAEIAENVDQTYGIKVSEFFEEGVARNRSAAFAPAARQAAP